MPDNRRIVYSKHDHLSDYWDITPESDEFFIIATTAHEEYAKHFCKLHNANLKPVERKDEHCAKGRCVDSVVCGVKARCELMP